MSQKIKDRIGIAVGLGLLSCFLFGCSTIGNGPLDVGSVYQAGRTFVFVDTITEPFQPEEVSAVIDQVYALGSIQLTTGDLFDEVVKEQIDELYKDSTPEARALIFNVYKAMFARIGHQIEINPDLPQPEVFSEFFRGVNDALAIYQPEVSDDAP